MNLYNTQQLLFSKTKKVTQYLDQKLEIPDDFYNQGFITLNNISSPEHAQKSAEIFLAKLDARKLSLLALIQEKIQLAKADAIPICDDSVETSFQALHFDMGQPIMGSESQLMINAIALYHPFNTPVSDAHTRILSLKGLFANRFSAQEVEAKLLQYVKKYGDGWGNINTYRLQCFARIIDAVSGTHDLADYRDKTMAQWFRDDKNLDGMVSLKNEQLFYKLRGLDLNQFESFVALQPGQMVIIDNTRVAHGRLGKRSEKEIYQFMFGLQANATEIESFRKNLVADLTSN